MNNMRDGFGKEVFLDGVTYEGEYKKDEFEGVGCISYSDKRQYQGEFNKGLRHGSG